MRHIRGVHADEPQRSRRVTSTDSFCRLQGKSLRRTIPGRTADGAAVFAGEARGRYSSAGLEAACYVHRVIKDDHRPALLDVRGVTKSFAGVPALRGVDLDILPGEVHCILGQNGAGKSTLIKTLAGVHRPDEGVISWRGEPVEIPTPEAAIELGIATMYQ